MRVGAVLSPQSTTTSRNTVPVAGAIRNAAGMPASIAVVGGVIVTLGPVAETVTVFEVLPPAWAVTVASRDVDKVERASAVRVGHGLSRVQLTRSGGEGDRYTRQEISRFVQHRRRQFGDSDAYWTGPQADRRRRCAADLPPPTVSERVAPEKAPITAVPDCVRP